MKEKNFLLSYVLALVIVVSSLLIKAEESESAFLGVVSLAEICQFLTLYIYKTYHLYLTRLLAWSYSGSASIVGFGAFLLADALADANL